MDHPQKRTQNRMASALESQRSWIDNPSRADPSPVEVTGELGPGLTVTPSLSLTRMAHEVLELRQEDLTIDQRIEGSEDESEEQRASAIQVIARRARNRVFHGGRS